ncbi:hypothetical protein BDQ17DRAFT_1543305 [Cyathus striatus]|nr:hypothetical protein BDQ17DRAFT_1543305 [Cyathus striatus]
MMSSVVPPLHREGFSYYADQFYVQVENSNHGRESASDLYSLLTCVAPTGPALTKAGKVAKRKPQPCRDPPCHFYRAQLLHYGLPDLKTKQPAKKKLLAAFKNGPSGEKILDVPPSILKLEKEMREEWTRLNEEELKNREKAAAKVEDEKLKAEKLEAELRERAICNELGRRYRPDDDREEESALPAFIIETRMAFLSLEKPVAEKLLDYILNQHWDTESDLRYELEKLGVIAKDRMGNFVDYPEGYTGKKIPRKYPSEEKSQSPDLGQPTWPLPSKSTAKQPSEPKRVNVIAGSSRGEKVIDLASDSDGERAPRTKLTARKSTAAANPPATKRGRGATSPKGQPSRKKQKNEIPKILLEACMGKFKVEVPTVSKDWPEYVSRDGLTIEFSPSSSGSHLWGHFDFGVIYGYIRSVGPAPTRADQKIQFLWRGRERGEEDMVFDDYTKGLVTFLADGAIEGIIRGHVLEKAKFTGYRSIEATGYKAQISDWKNEFRSLNDGAHCDNERWCEKRVSDEGRIEPPADSDTTDSDGNRSDDPEDDYPYNFDSDSDIEF